jgi:drug/metabolite transporter (DMT)-like permease
MLNTALLATVTVSLAVGQLLFKRTGLAIQDRTMADGLLAMMRQPAFYAALTLYGLTTLLWIWVLSRVPLSQAYPWVALTTAIVPCIGWLVFGERIAPTFWLGMALILLGLFITQFWGAA